MSRLVGAHVSSSGGWEKAPQRAAELGCNSMQIFTGSPRIWKSKSANEFDYAVLERAREKYGIKESVIHATYLINLASENPDLIKKSEGALVNDLNVCSRGRFVGVVVHVGSHMGRGYEQVRMQLVEAIKRIIDHSEGGMFLIENSAGQKGKIGSRLEEIKDLIETIGSERLGWCVDTCHAFAGGYWLGSNKFSELSKDKRVSGSKNENVGLFEVDRKLAIGEIDRLDLWKSLKCVHVNESKDGFDSGRDRHENLGMGRIGNEAMREFLSHPKLTQVPKVLEVPGFDGRGPDKKNVEVLKKLLG